MIIKPSLNKTNSYEISFVFLLKTVSFKILPNGIKNILYTFAIGITREKLQSHTMNEIKGNLDNCAFQSKNCKKIHFWQIVSDWILAEHEMDIAINRLYFEIKQGYFSIYVERILFYFW